MALKRDFAARYLAQVADLWIAKRGKTAHGFMGCNGSTVEMLFIEPEYWGQGMGRALLDKATAAYGKLRIFVNEQNLLARAFYQKLGFKVIGGKPLDDAGRPYPLLELEGPTG